MRGRIESVASLLSGGLSSGQISDGSVTSGSIASGQVGFPHLADGSVQSGTIASGQVSRFHIASGSITNTQIASGGLSSGSIGSGQISTLHVASGGLLSGAIGSGQLGSYHHASGTEITNALFGAIDVGALPATAETISGVRAVTLSLSGQFRIAMTNISGRMPAMGVYFGNALSGVVLSGPGLYWGGGPFQLPAGMSDFPALGKTVYVGRSGQLVTFSGSWNSGGFVSGDLAQSVGTVVNSGAVILNINSPVGFALSGPVPSLLI